MICIFGTVWYNDSWLFYHTIQQLPLSAMPRGRGIDINDISMF